MQVYKIGKYILGTVATATFMMAAAQDIDGASLEFEGNSRKVLSFDAEKSTGLEKIYMVYDMTGVSLRYPVGGRKVKWYRFRNMGGGYAEEVSSLYEDSYSVVAEAEGNTGYIVEDGDLRYCFWIAEYKGQEFTINSIMAGSESDCDRTVLNVEGFGQPIHYYTINGQSKILSREIRVSYDTEIWDEGSTSYVKKETEKLIDSMSTTIAITPPAYCSTYFTVTGDRFLEAWGEAVDKESAVYSPSAVEVHAAAIQDNQEDSEDAEPSNMLAGEGSGLGGSAPAEITFVGYATEAVIHDEWQLSRTEDFETVEYRFNQRELTYTFTEEGQYFMRYIGSNSDGSCESESEVFTISIGASDLKIPNAFSPDGDGVNDVWKVAYRSLIEFKCWIFDRYGKQLHYFDNPSEGWNGKQGNKVVKPGVYYYVIQAQGADGKRYHRSGDINIIRYKTFGGNQTEE